MGSSNTDAKDESETDSGDAKTVSRSDSQLFAEGEKVYAHHHSCLYEAKNIKRFGKKGKLAPKFVGPFEIVKRIGEVTYKMKLHPLMRVHDVFHVFMLRWCLRDPSQEIPLVDIEVHDDCSYLVKPIVVLDFDTKNTQNSKIELVKVQWGEELLDASWEVKSSMEKLYLNLFHLSQSTSTYVTRSSRTS